MISLLPTKQRECGYHKCNAEYGWCGEHRAFRATYECPECGHVFEIDQCAAWPITVLDCGGCFVSLDCELNQKLTKATLR
jgi:transcription elongation factor Elf1